MSGVRLREVTAHGSRSANRGYRWPLQRDRNNRNSQNEPGMSFGINKSKIAVRKKALRRWKAKTYPTIRGPYGKCQGTTDTGPRLAEGERRVHVASTPPPNGGKSK